MDINLTGAAITGMGVICPIGLDIDSMCESLQLARGGIGKIDLFSTEGLRVQLAAQVRDYDALKHFSAEQALELDRTAQLAVVAARQAVSDAGLSHEELASGRIGLVLGICAGGIGNGGIGQAPEQWTSKRDVKKQLYSTAHYCQTEVVAATLGITGPCLTVSTACASSTSALASALTLLQSGHVDAVIVGGADAFSIANFACFYSVGAMSEQPASPFSVDIGITCGEGAGCIVIENERRLSQRKVQVHGVLLACGKTSDAYHVTAPHPSGEGLCRAMRLALADADLSPSAVQYINAHGTGTHDNDIAETLAIRSLYKDEGTIPPVSSTKSYFGHMLGGTGIVEFIAALLGLKHDFLPPTLNFKSARAGCDLDYVPNKPRSARFDTFISSSAAFGGVNAVAIGARAGTRQRSVPPPSQIMVTGLGTISPIGVGIEEFHLGLQQGKNGIVPIDRFDVSGLGCRHAGLVPEFSWRQLTPMVDVRRMDKFSRYAVTAAALALTDAGLFRRLKAERIGLHVAMTRGPLVSQQAFQASLAHDGIAGLSPKHFPAIVLSTVSGQISMACQIKGASFTFVDGPGAGLQALVHGRDYLARHPELDALIVVAVDEVGSLYQHLFDYLGLLAAGAEAPQLYSPVGAGCILGEGAVAMVLEREEHAGARQAFSYGWISGAALGRGIPSGGQIDPEGERLEAVARKAVEAGGGMPDVIYGMAHGSRHYDARESKVVKRLLQGHAARLVCLNGQLGLAEAAGGLFAASAALLGLRHGEAYRSLGCEHAPAQLPLVRSESPAGNLGKALVLGCNEYGNYSAVMFSKLGVV